jgi:hypothetical protein
MSKKADALKRLELLDKVTLIAEVYKWVKAAYFCARTQQAILEVLERNKRNLPATLLNELSAVFEQQERAMERADKISLEEMQTIIAATQKPGPVQ